MTEPPKKSASSSASIELFKKAHLKSPSEKIEEIKRGIPAHRVGSLALEMSVSQTSLLNAMGLSRATVHHKANKMALLSKSESALVLGVESLIGQGHGGRVRRWVGFWSRKMDRALDCFTERYVGWRTAVFLHGYDGRTENGRTGIGNVAVRCLWVTGLVSNWAKPKDAKNPKCLWCV